MNIGEFVINKHNNRSYVYCGTYAGADGDIIYVLCRCDINKKIPQDKTITYNNNNYIYYGLNIEDDKKIFIGSKDLEINYVSFNDYIHNRILK
jgi:hypothetical protein